MDGAPGGGGPCTEVGRRRRGGGSGARVGLTIDGSASDTAVAPVTAESASDPARPLRLFRYRVRVIHGEETTVLPP